MTRFALIGFAVCACAAGQTLSFDVASVKPSEQSFLVLSPQRSGGRIQWTTSLPLVLQYAYQMETWRISGAIPEGIFTFEATTSPDTTTDQIRLMFQTLLTERFKMVAHVTQKDVDGFALKVGKSGIKIKAVKDGDPPPPMPEWFAKFDSKAWEGQVSTTLEGKGVGAFTGRKVSMAKVAEALGRLERTLVIDETGLSGTYYIAFQFARDNMRDDVDLPPLNTALQENTGLKLEKHRGQVEALVVDRMEKMPSEN